jgi:hypothetical protein
LRHSRFAPVWCQRSPQARALVSTHPQRSGRTALQAASGASPARARRPLTQFTSGSSACGEHEACRLAALKRKSGEESQSGLGAIGATIDRGASSGKYAALPGFEPMTQEQT